MNRSFQLIAMLGLAAYCLLPWYGVDYGIFEPDWIEAGGLLSEAGASGLLRMLVFRDATMAIPAIAFLVLIFAGSSVRLSRRLSVLSMAAAIFALCAIVLHIKTGGSPIRSFGYGSTLVITTLFLSVTNLWSRLGSGNRDAFVVSSIAFVCALILLFVFYPIAQILVQAFVDKQGSFSVLGAFRIATGGDIWSIGCLLGKSRCGVAVNSIILGLLTATSTTILGLAFALLMSRTRFPGKPLLRALAVLPIITPPFVIGLALILLFGRAGFVTDTISGLLGLEASRWLYGLWGIWLGQTLAFTPIAFLVLTGVVQGISPSLEEASQTLRADLSSTLRTVSLPLMKPGIANAFLLAFIESLADFGNPVVLGGADNVLSTEIYFAIVGAQANMMRAAVLSLILLALTLTVFMIQKRWLGRTDFTTITGKADNGANSMLSRNHKIVVYGLTLPWMCFTTLIYVMVFYGSVVKLWGQDHTLTLAHYREAFEIGWSDGGIWWKGAAWDSFWTTISISAIAAPLTAGLGLLTAWLLVRQKFAGRSTFEFLTMLSFAVPGTVVGVSYILAFNNAPIELTGTGTILVLCFIFRNMPVGVRGGVAAMKQLDNSLDEASLTLGANSFKTLRHVVLPLMRPAIISAIAYSFIRAITSVSAVIFLVGTDHNMATAYIIGLVENGSYGLAIAYSTVLIVVMLVVVTILQVAFGKTRLRREDRIGQQLSRPVVA
ncbi:ABC transporter permease [Phyllobacterium myrsinacearum]|uniref:Iron(III) transport system permease protein n=1 Tax=Phyllobacterium myrsinacearum TaxID=28101 RepID=A0A839EHS5_9HYPH|nr:iron ABC transporter permease [Phyllobacterium myrsinacearum]MBA8879541.1 iron(III) transport system permease protein [Phyllobacterium myrsinacearum]